MLKVYLRQFLFMGCILVSIANPSFSQSNFKLKYKKSDVYAGIEVGSKGVKMSLVEVGRNSQKSLDFNILKDTSVNTDFISFTPQSFSATLSAITSLYRFAMTNYHISSDKIFTVVSSGVKVQAEKLGSLGQINRLVDSFRIAVNEPTRQVEIVDVLQEARLSHLGIVPESRRYNTFLIDIGSGNTKGGYFPNGNTTDFRLFQLSWGTKSTANAVQKRLQDDQTIYNYSKQLYRVLAGTANDEITYAVNLSGAYNMSDNVAFSGGIAWSVATLVSPELMDNPVIPVTYDEVEKFFNRLIQNYNGFSEEELVKTLGDPTLNRAIIGKEIKRVHAVFDQQSLLAGTGLLLKIMRQFEGLYDKKQFYLVKNGQVGWISAYVDQAIAKTDQTVAK